jgi:hypothetical protein
MWKTIVIVLGLLVVVMLAQTSGPSSLVLSPLGAVSNCASSSTGDVLCAATDGFYISVAGGTFQKVATGQGQTPPPTYTQLTCTTATLGSNGLNASGCTFSAK